MLSRMTGFGGLGRSTHRLDWNELSLDLVLIVLEIYLETHLEQVLVASRECF